MRGGGRRKRRREAGEEGVRVKGGEMRGGVSKQDQGSLRALSVEDKKVVVRRGGKRRKLEERIRGLSYNDSTLRGGGKNARSRPQNSLSHFPPKTVLA